MNIHIRTGVVLLVLSLFFFALLLLPFTLLYCAVGVASFYGCFSVCFAVIRPFEILYIHCGQNVITTVVRWSMVYVSGMCCLYSLLTFVLLCVWFIWNFGILHALFSSRYLPLFQRGSQILLIHTAHNNTPHCKCCVRSIRHCSSILLQFNRHASTIQSITFPSNTIFSHLSCHVSHLRSVVWRAFFIVDQCS